MRPPIATNLALSIIFSSWASVAHSQEPSPPLIPIEFELTEPGQVTLVIEDAEGQRVRNLISQESFPAGKHQVYWDGLDDRSRDPESAKHSVFHIPGKIVAPGSYTVRGLVHPGIDLLYQLTPYTNGNPPWRTDDNSSQWLTNHSAPSDVIFLPAGRAPERVGKPASKEGQILVCSKVAEGGSGLAWVGLDGKKLWGQHWLGGVWTAASHLAVDDGPNPVPGTYAYAAASWSGDKYNNYQPELRLHRLMDAAHWGKAPKDKRMGSGEDRPVLEPNYSLPLPVDAPALASKEEREMKAYYKTYAPELTGMAVRSGIVICAFAKINLLVIIDAHQGKVLGTAELADPRGLTFDTKGNLLALSGSSLVRIPWNERQPLPLATPKILVENLDAPQRIATSKDGNIFVSEWGNSHQIRIFAEDGTARGTLGDAGPPQIGKYNPNHFNHPSGMAMDDRGRLWVTENFHTPKRVSIWNMADRTLADAFYGPMRYGGSGAVDPQDRTRFFYDDDHGGTIEFKLDYATGRSFPVALPYLESANNTGLAGRYVGQAPSFPIRFQKHLYLTDAYSLHTTGRRSASLWRMDSDGIARIVAAAGNIIDSDGNVLPAFTDPAIQARMPEGFRAEKDKHLLFVWSDQNANQKLDANEVQFLNPDEYASADGKRKGIGTVSVSRDLKFAFSFIGDAIVALAPSSADKDGVPIYELGKREVIARGAQRPSSSGGNQVLLADKGWTVTTTPVAPLSTQGIGGVRNGKAVWSYPSLWPGLHASHIAPMPENPGQLIGTTRLIGDVIDAPPGSDAGQLWAINANKGTIYVFTVDGLFVTRLFQDSRTASWNAPEARQGMNVNHLSLHEECFGPMWTRTDDGEVYLQGGGTGNIVKVANLDKIRRLPDRKIAVTPQQLQTAQQWAIEQESRRQSDSAKPSKPLQARIATEAPTLDGSAEDWQGAEWVEIDRRKQKVGNWGKRDIATTASVFVHSGTLYAVWKTYDQDLLRNSGESPTNLFKTGGALDLMIGTSATADPKRPKAVQGDLRLLVSQPGGKTAAMLYEPVSPGAKTPPVEFGSPLRTIQFDRVTDISDRVKLVSTTVPDLKADKNGSIKLTTFELAIPLELLGFQPEKGREYAFDIGVLRGDGSQTLQRAYWHNKASGLVSDIPSEAELLPALWGKVIFAKN
jgi:hypothetical protein